MQIKKNAPAMPCNTASANNTDPTTSRCAIVAPHQDDDKLVPFEWGSHRGRMGGLA